jgi:type I restriction enzyme S subunit
MSRGSVLEKLLDGVTVEWKRLGDVADIGTGSSNRQDENENGLYPFYVRSKNVLKSDTFQFDEVAIVIPGEGGIGDIFHYVEGKYALHQRAYRIHITSDMVSTKFLYYIMSANFKQYISMKSVGATAISIRKPMLEDYQIPIPCPNNPEKSLAIQAEIVRILDAFTTYTTELTAELTARKKQYTYYRDQLLNFEGNGGEGMSRGSVLEKLLDGVTVEWLPLGDVTQYEQPNKYLVESTNYSNEFGTPVLTAGKTFILGYTDEISGIYKASENPVIIFDDFTAANKWVDFDFKVKSSAMKMISSSDEGRFLIKYIYYWLNTLPSELVDSDHKRLWIGNYSNKRIPIPCPDNPEKSLEIQAEIVRILDKFYVLTTSLTEGLPREIELRQKQYEYYRDKLFTFMEAGHE